MIYLYQVKRYEIQTSQSKGGKHMKKVMMAYWYNTHDESINGYELSDYNTDTEIFSGTMEECLQFAKDNNMKIYKA